MFTILLHILVLHTPHYVIKEKHNHAKALTFDICLKVTNYSTLLKEGIENLADVNLILSILFVDQVTGHSFVKKINLNFFGYQTTHFNCRYCHSANLTNLLPFVTMACNSVKTWTVRGGVSEEYR